MAYRRTYPKGYAGIAISEETHQRLTKLRDKYNEKTYDIVINKLLNLEEKYNPPTEVFEYEYIINNGSKLFKVTYSDTITIEYYNYNTLQFEENIQAWFTGNRISDKELDHFIKFIIKNSSLMELYEMDTEVVTRDLHIRRLENGV